MAKTANADDADFFAWTGAVLLERIVESDAAAKHWRSLFGGDGVGDLDDEV